MAKLSRRDVADAFRQIGAEQVDAQLQGRFAIHIGKTDLQNDLGLGGGNQDAQQIDDFAEGGGNADGAIGDEGIFHRAAQKDVGVLNRHRDIGADFTEQLAANSIGLGTARENVNFVGRAVILVFHTIRLVLPGDFPLRSTSVELTATASAISPLVIEMRRMLVGCCKTIESSTVTVRSEELELETAGESAAGGRIAWPGRTAANRNAAIRIFTYFFSCGISNFCSLRLVPLKTSMVVVSGSCRTAIGRIGTGSRITVAAAGLTSWPNRLAIDVP